MKKKILSLVLALILVLALSPAVYAAEIDLLQSNGSVAVIFGNITSTSAEQPASSLHENTDGMTFKWGEIKTFYCAAPATVSTGYDFDMFWDKASVKGEPVYGVSAHGEGMRTLSEGTYFCIVGGEWGFYVVVGGSAPTTTTPPVTPITPVIVNPTASTVLVDGESTAFEAYLIGGNNFFKLRDLAYAINGSEKQFSVGWNAAENAISLTSGKAYEPVGGEMAKGDGAAKAAHPTTSKVFLDGVELDLTAYNIAGNNFFRLRDLMKALDIGVTWDASTSTIGIDTSIPYTE